MDKDDDPWEILGVPRDASEADIKKAFRKGALKYHPDKQQTEEDRIAAHDIFAKLSAAYDTVTDPVKRYDWKLAEEKRCAKTVKQSSPSTNNTVKKQPVNTARPTTTTATATPNRPQASRPSTASSGGSTGTPPQRQTKASPGPIKKPTGPRPSDKAPKVASSPTATVPKTSPVPTTKKTTSSPHVQSRPSVASSSPTAAPKRQSVPTDGPKSLKTAPPSQKRASAPTTSGGGAVQRQPKTAGTQPTFKVYRDPFDVFDKVMKEEFGDNYKDREDSGWKASIGVPGLAKINPFKAKSENSKKEFQKLDVNNDKTLSKDELEKYIQSHSDLWSTLGVNLNLPVKKCIEVATDVAFSLAKGEDNKTKPRTNKDPSKANAPRELTEAEFKRFHQNYVLNAKGSHEFFLRTIFAVFDLNNDGVLNAKELDKFLDLFYKAKDIFKGDMKLPEKKHLVKIVGTRLDENRDGALQFDEIRDLLEVAAVVTTEKQN